MTTTNNNKLPGKEIITKFILPTTSKQDDQDKIDNNQEIQIPLFVDMNVGIGGDIWPAAQCFCSWMFLDISTYHFFATLYNDKKILELGSGNALVSILIEKAFSPKKVVVTDLLSHVPHMQHNLEMNSCQYCEAISLDWCNEDDKLAHGPFDVILALECLYREDLYEPLIKTMLRMSHQESVFIMGVTRAFVKPKFFTLLKSYGFRYRKIPAQMLENKMPYDPATGLFIVQRIAVV